MNFRLVFHICVFLWTLNLSEGFFANQFSQFVGSKDYTHADITEIGILQAVAEYFESTPGGSTLGVGSLTGIQNITARKLFDRYYGGTRSAKRFQEAINQIIQYNNKVDLDHYNEAAWHFNGEQITEANKKLIDIRGNLLKELKKSQPNYESARELIGQFFHIMQMFYSNTNFIDQIGQNMYPAIGMTGTMLMKTAGASMDTCKSCKPPWHPCVFNILPTLKTTSVLTSSYKGGQDIKKPFKDPKAVKEGKCSHGGPTDPDTFKSAATGGINKDSSIPAYSPHFYKHPLAAKAAIDHTKYFFQDATLGLHYLIGEDKYKELLQIKPSHSLVFVIDQSGSMAAELPIIAQESRVIIQNASASSNAPENYILVTFSDPGTSTLVKDTTKSADLISWIGAIQATGGNDCPEFSLTGIEATANAAHPDSILYVFTDSTPKDPYKQEKIDSLIASKRLRIFFIVIGTCSTTNQNGLKFSDNLNHAIEPLRHKRSTTTWDPIDVYRHLASVSGGHVFQTTKDQIPNALGILQSTLSGAEVLILHNVYPGGPSSPKSFEIAVDASISQFALKMHGKQDIPRFILKDSRGNVNQIDNKTITLYNIGKTYLSIVVKNPRPGIWTVRKNDISEWDVEVTARSTLDFTAKFMKNYPAMFSFYEISGRPIPNENVTLVIDINDKTVIKDLTHVSLLDVYGDEIAHYSLKKKDRISNRRFFMTSIIVPHEMFKLAVIGTTSAGGPFIRMHRDLIKPVNIELDHIPEKVPLYINENLNVSFIVKNAGSQDEDVKVTIEDDKHFAISPQSRTFHLKAWSNHTSYFTVHGGQTKGETTTITLTALPASPSGTNTKYQYIITYLTVEERKIDKMPPVCHVSSSPVSCGSDPCKCSQTNVYITAEIWDEGDGLDEITAPNTPTNSLLLNGFNKGLVKAVGIVSATLMVNCCRKNVKIDVKDLKNLTGSCDIPVDPTYDINACTTTTPSSMTLTTTPTSTTITPTSTSSMTKTALAALSSSATSPAVFLSQSQTAPTVPTKITGLLNNQSTTTTDRHDVSCNPDSMSVYIPSALLSQNNYLTWTDPHCKVINNGTHYISTVSHTACGTIVKFTHDEVIFENDIFIRQLGATPPTSPNDTIDFGSDSVDTISVQCIYPRRQNVTMSYRPANTHIRFYEKRYGHMDVQLEQYQSDKFVSVISGTSYPREVLLNKDMYIKLRAMHTNTTDIAIKVDSCVATPSAMPADGSLYQLIDHGCPASPAVKLYPSSFDEVKFSVKAFQFKSSPGSIVYIHCQISVCSPTNPQCVTGCKSRHRRDVDEADDSSHLVSGGPYLLVADKGSLQMSTVVAGVCACLAVVATVFAVIGWKRKSTKYNLVS